MKKIVNSLIGAFSALSLVYAHNGEEESFTAGINPFEYFSHGYELGGILIILLWILILWGIYTITTMVLAKHIKTK